MSKSKSSCPSNLWAKLTYPNDHRGTPHGGCVFPEHPKIPRILVVGFGRYMGVSFNGGTPKSSILIGFSIINHPFWGTPVLRNTHILHDFIGQCFRWNCWGLIFTNPELRGDNAGVIFIRVISGAKALTGCNTAGKLDTKNSIDKNKQSWKSQLSSSNLFSDDKSNSYRQNQSHTATPTAWKITSSSLSLISARPHG